MTNIDIQAVLRNYKAKLKPALEQEFGVQIQEIYPGKLEKGLETGEFTGVNGIRYKYELNGKAGTKSLTQLKE